MVVVTTSAAIQTADRWVARNMRDEISSGLLKETNDRNKLKRNAQA